MKKQIELNQDYLMILKIQYIKNMSTGKKSYEIYSKIVKKEDYLEDEDCVGEIDGEFLSIINLYTPFTSIFKKRYRAIVKNKIRNTIDKFISQSKELVEEWEQNEDVLKDAELYIEHK